MRRFQAADSNKDGYLEGKELAGVNAPASHFYAVEASRRAGLGDDGAVRAGIAPYTTTEDVDRLVRAVSQKLTPA